MKSALRSQVKKFVLRNFHRIYYNARSETWQATQWLGKKILKCPLDLWVYQEMIQELRPDVILETGTCEGGSAHFLATMCDLVGTGRIISVDIERKPNFPIHPRIVYLTGSSTSEEIVRQVQTLIGSDKKIMVILDSDHSKAHVLREMELYAPLVNVGSYLIVEDTNVNGHPVRPEFGPGPYEAVKEFLGTRKDFVRDPAREKFLMTFNPSGYLKRIS